MLLERKAILFLRNFVRHLDAAMKGHRHEDIIKAAVAGVKFFAIDAKQGFVSEQAYSETEGIISIQQAVYTILGKLSPQEIAQLFPPPKVFRKDGDFKDYYFDKRLIERYGGSEGFSDEDAAMNFICEYYQDDILLFNFSCIHYTDVVRRQRGQPSMIEEFCENKLGFDPNFVRIRVGKDASGKEIYLSDNGELLGLKKKKAVPKWLRRIK